MGVFRFFRSLRRKSVLEAPMPEAWRAEVARVVPFAARLEPESLEKLESLVRVFMAEKSFEGAGGLELTEPMCAAIAARACMLVLFRVELDGALYPDLDAVVVYPGAYVAKSTRADGHLVTESDEPRLGESWTRGVVVLSWASAERGARRPSDGHDVVVHEFAHQLDAQDGAMDGAPVLDREADYAAWARALSPAYDGLVRASREGRPAELDAYGATDPAEFFAVAVEAFFERPRAMRASEPEVYAQFVQFFKMDPMDSPVRKLRDVA